MGTACQPSTQKGRSALSTLEGIDPTKHHQVGFHYNSLHHRRPNSGFSFRPELLDALADVHGNQIHCHPNVRSWGGWALAATMALHSREMLAGASEGAAQQQTLEQSRDPGRRVRARSPIAVLEQLRDRIHGFSQDMHALNKSCCVEMATSSAPSAATQIQDHGEEAARRNTRRKRSSGGEIEANEEFWHRRTQIGLRCWIGVYQTARGFLECNVRVQIVPALGNQSREV